MGEAESEAEARRLTETVSFWAGEIRSLCIKRRGGGEPAVDRWDCQCAKVGRK